VNDERRPDYVKKLEVSARLVPVQDRDGRLRPVVEIRNKGDEVVSLLSFRVVVFDADGRPIWESNEWGATPIAAELPWRGPLMPGATRSFPCRPLCDGGRHSEDLRVQTEITDVRVWRAGKPETVSEHTGSSVKHR